MNLGNKIKQKNWDENLEIVKGIKNIKVDKPL